MWHCEKANAWKYYEKITAFETHNPLLKDNGPTEACWGLKVRRMFPGTSYRMVCAHIGADLICMLLIPFIYEVEKMLVLLL